MIFAFDSTQKIQIHNILSKKQHSTTSLHREQLSLPLLFIVNIFFSGTGDDRITINIYELRTYPDYVDILKSIPRKLSLPENHSTIYFIPYSIQGFTNKDIYRTIILKKYLSQTASLYLYITSKREMVINSKLNSNTEYILK